MTNVWNRYYNTFKNINFNNIINSDKEYFSRQNYNHSKHRVKSKLYLHHLILLLQPLNNKLPWNTNKQVRIVIVSRINNEILLVLTESGSITYKSYCDLWFNNNWILRYKTYYQLHGNYNLEFVLWRICSTHTGT